MVDRTEQHIGNYRLTRRIASGGMADVYLASHIYLQKQVAVKILHSWMSEYEEKAFLQEARIIAGLNHPHIIRIEDFGVNTNDNRSFAYLIMEYASSSLANLYPVGTPVPFATIGTYVSDIASALNYAHEQGVVHRDVKPSNILLSVNGTVLLSDFGIATFMNADKESTLDHTITGTPIFMAPEQIMGKARPASDQYALGIMVYEWLCGFPPFTGSTTQLFAQQMNMAPPPLRSRLPSISPEVEQVVFIALAKKPEDRFANINAFANALSTALRSAESIQLPRTEPQPLSPYATEPASNLQMQPPLLAQQSAYNYGSPSYLRQNPASGAFPKAPIDTGDQGYTTLSSSDAPWGVQDPAYTQGPPTISDAGYFPPAYDHGGSNTAQTYFPSQSPTGYLPSGSISGSPPRTFFSLLLALLAAPFIFVAETIVKLTQQAGGQFQPDLPPTARLSSGGGGWPSEVSAKTRERFFIIYHREDQLWAEWIAWHLEQAGYSAILPSWDFYAGSNLNMEITRASTKADCVIIVLSPAFFSTPDSLRNLKRDLSGKQDTVLPVIVHEYKIAHKHPLNDLVAISLVNLNKEAAQARLLSAVRRERQKPMSQPVFPPEFITPISPDNVKVSVPTSPDASTVRLPETPLESQTRTQVDADITNHNPNITIVLRSEISPYATVNFSNISTTTQNDVTIQRVSGDVFMTIEQNALNVATFLNALREKIVADPEFGKIYGDSGRMDNQIAMLASALMTNLQRLDEARINQSLFPTRSQYRDEVDGYLQGLATTTQRIEQTWREFRATTLTKIAEEQEKVEQEQAQIQEAQEQETEEEKTVPLGQASTDVASQKKGARANWIKASLSGLGQFNNFLTLATDIDKAVTQWSPALFEGLNHALEALSQLHL